MLIEKVPSTGMTPIQDLANKMWDANISWSQLAEQREKDAQKNPELYRESAFAHSLLGNLSQAEKNLDAYCAQKNAVVSLCQKTVFSFEIKNPRDNTGKVLDDVEFEVLWWDVEKSPDGTYATDMYKNIVFRTKVSKKWYTDFITNERFVPWYNEEVPYKKVVQSPVLVGSQETKIVQPGESFTMKTQNYTFIGSYDNFLVTNSQEPVEVHFFDLWRDIPDFSASWLLSLHIFDSRESMVWFGMNTFGMPLVKAYQGDLELAIKPDFPIRVQGKMQNHDDYLYMVGKQDRESAEIYSQIPAWTVITVDNAEDLGMPPFWHFDKNTGTWVDSTYTVLDQQGTVESLLF